MATAFMKWLETRPASYDRGIRILTLGRLDGLHARLVSGHMREGIRVLEIGCGTGALTVRMAEAGAQVVAIDHAANMLAEADGRVRKAGLQEMVELHLLDAGVIADRWPPASFDMVIASLALSEMDPELRDQVLWSSRRLLNPSGRFLIVDETSPRSSLRRALYTAVNIPLQILTWALTRTTTHPLKQIESELADAGWEVAVVDQGLGGSLRVWEAVPSRGYDESSRAARVSGTLAHRISLRTLLLDLWELFFRIIPPYPKVRPGLYKLGEPGRGSAVLVTGNFDLTVRRLARALDGRVNAWVLVVDSGGINVWCAAGGGFLTAEKIISAAKVTRLEAVVDGHTLILPQLCANGVAGWKIRDAGWNVRWGPIQADDLPEYLGRKLLKSDRMREASFPLKDRLEMTTVTLGFYGLLILLPIAIFWSGLLLPAALALTCIAYFYALAMPWIPGRDGLAKSLPLALISLLGLACYTAIWDPVAPALFFNRSLGVVALAVFTAAEMQGMSPLMRGEQANWIWEGVIAGILLVMYFGVPFMMGWS
jgi:ubiquinone/menaquinone biosynthesis C-methylase UbiE